MARSLGNVCEINSDQEGKGLKKVEQDQLLKRRYCDKKILGGLQMTKLEEQNSSQHRSFENVCAMILSWP